jgi:hypothetical protein
MRTGFLSQTRPKAFKQPGRIRVNRHGKILNPSEVRGFARRSPGYAGSPERSASVRCCTKSANRAAAGLEYDNGERFLLQLLFAGSIRTLPKLLQKQCCPLKSLVERMDGFMIVTRCSLLADCFNQVLNHRPPVRVCRSGLAFPNKSCLNSA